MFTARLFAFDSGSVVLKCPFCATNEYDPFESLGESPDLAFIYCCHPHLLCLPYSPDSPLDCKVDLEHECVRKLAGNEYTPQEEAAALDCAEKGAHLLGVYELHVLTVHQVDGVAVDDFWKYLQKSSCATVTGEFTYEASCGNCLKNWSGQFWFQP